MIGIPLIEHDPDLFAGLDRIALNDARGAIAPAWQIEEGTWTPPSIDPGQAPFGLLLLSGFVARHLSIRDGSSVEVLGPGDVLRPWIEPDEQLGAEGEWEALETSLIAVLDVRFGSVALRHPAIITTLMDRYAAQSTWTALHLAVCHIVGLDKRLEAMFWLLAERWGRVSPDGVILPLRLSHEFLARLVGVRRPSVTSAVTRLRQEGVLERRTDGSWLLHGSPPAELAEVGDEVLSAAG